MGIQNNDKINLNGLLKDYIIYIPDMQRDYCWGTTKADKTDKHGNSLFKNFLDTLVQNCNENKTEVQNYNENKKVVFLLHILLKTFSLS